MSVLWIAWRKREAAVEIGGKRRQGQIGRLHTADVLPSQLLDQTVLQRLVHPFHTAFSLRSVGADQLDVELLHSACELRHAFSPKVFFGGDPKDAELVA